MKTRYKSSEIAHAWVHQLSPYGSAGRSSFGGAAFWSYSTCIARFVDHNGKRAVIINDNRFSQETAKHHSRVASALPMEIPRFYAWTNKGASLTHSGAQLYGLAINSALKAQTDAAKTRKSKKKDLLISDQARWLERAKEINAFFGLRKRVDDKAIDRLRRESAKAEAERIKELAAHKALLLEKYRESFEQWKDGKDPEHQCWLWQNRFPVAFRVEGNHLVSTLGALVPLEDAKRAHELITSFRSMGVSGEIPIPIGGYKIDRLDEQGIIAGCHRISWAEIERLAPYLS